MSDEDYYDYNALVDECEQRGWRVMLHVDANRFRITVDDGVRRLDGRFAAARLAAHRGTVWTPHARDLAARNLRVDMFYAGHFREVDSA